MNNKSFTLIELLVVIVIIGILAGVIMISTSSSIGKAGIAKVKVFEESVQNNLAANMISKWALDGDTNDMWGENNALWGGIGGSNTFANYRTESECISGKCFDFDGYDDYLEIPHNLNLSPDEVTISFWIKLTSDPNTSTDNNFRRIYTAISTYAPFYLYLEENKSINFSVIVSGMDYRYIGNNFSGETLTIGKWTLLTYVYSKDGYGKAYKNSDISRSGKMKTSAALECPGGILSKNTSSNYRISWPAGTSTPNGNGAIPGLIDDVKIYGAPLSQAYIKKEYITGLNSLFYKGLMSKDEYNERILNIGLQK
ncbi:MAG TPA: prepilin-type N-terminal cleavage/methylation domain-containing protein [Candidatus Pacearchaeota archaeon]|nr:prepilin-type N-terminal cleavage/methylation domain-containing protein [Candidatus Pacearchaeota archaeon]